MGVDVLFDPLHRAIGHEHLDSARMPAAGGGSVVAVVIICGVSGDARHVYPRLVIAPFYWSSGVLTIRKQYVGQPAIGAQLCISERSAGLIAPNKSSPILARTGKAFGDAHRVAGTIANVADACGAGAVEDRKLG